jgi:GNAT superfamily N-acetyltransferase
MASSLDEDLRLEVNDPSGVAEALLWWTHVPEMPGERLGVIGGFQATSGAASEKVLARATTELQRQGCSLAVGPMDGNTWRKYRFVLEPSNPPEWPAWWRSAGFSPLADYYSSATNDLTTRDPRLDAAEARMDSAGITIRHLALERFEEDLVRIHDVSAVAFQGNYLYTPLPREAFVSQYLALRAYVRPELVLLAEQAGHPVGYVFAIPDYAQAQRGEPLTTVIAKTLAVLPSRTNAGLGALLLGRVHEAARSLGFTRAIHALMHESNNSRNLSARYAHTIRRYTLFSKRISP